MFFIKVLLSKKEKQCENCHLIAHYLELIDDFGNLKMN